MSFHSVVEGTQQATLHVIAGGLSLTSVGVAVAAVTSALPTIALVVGIVSGLVSITAYSLDIMDKPRFQRFLARFRKS